MKYRALLVLPLLCAAVGLGLHGLGGSAAVAAGPRAPVLVELFTSEGCSSCPPADVLLDRLDREQSVKGAEVIALEMHVDYWNRLGWTDPFSSRGYSSRQQSYVAPLRARGPYTPQMVIDGAAEFIGSDEDRAEGEIAQAARVKKLPVQLGRQGDVLTVKVGPAEGAAEVWLALTERGLSTRVPRGENAGAHLRHGPVVRRLSRLGTLSPTGFSGKVPLRLLPGWRAERVRAVVFVQQPGQGRVLGAAAL